MCERAYFILRARMLLIYEGESVRFACVSVFMYALALCQQESMQQIRSDGDRLVLRSSCPADDPLWLQAASPQT